MTTQTIEQSVEVEVPIRQAYDQWTQFEEFPRFMEGVERVEQRDDRHLHWVASFGGRTHEWDAEITEHHRADELPHRRLRQAGILEGRRTDSRLRRSRSTATGAT